MTEENLYQACQRYPLLIVISGPSGVGKDTIARRLIELRPDDFYFVVTATTRPPRAGEVHGRDYFFVSTDDFARMIENDELLEYAVVYNDYKGVPKQQIRDALASGRDVIMRVDVQGAAKIRQLIPNAIFVFLMTESEEELVRRLRERKSETAEGLSLRIATARQEMRRIHEFDYCVINAEGAQETAVRQILSIIEAAHCRVHQEPITL
ncbi:MAG: guanylate kinase [Chloroflexi bacterium]|nr:MAG: guanylate kinase [Chloroflexota bacterium]